MPGSLEPDRDEGGGLQSFVRYSHLGLQFALTIGLLTAAGVWADRKWGLMPLFTLIGLFLGFGAGFYSLYRAVYAKKL